MCSCGPASCPGPSMKTACAVRWAGMVSPSARSWSGPRWDAHSRTAPADGSRPRALTSTTAGSLPRIAEARHSGALRWEPEPEGAGPASPISAALPRRAPCTELRDAESLALGAYGPAVTNPLRAGARRPCTEADYEKASGRRRGCPRSDTPGSSTGRPKALRESPCMRTCRDSNSCRVVARGNHSTESEGSCVLRPRCTR